MKKVMVIMIAMMFTLVLMSAPQAARADLIISEIYGGGGSAAGPYFTNDYVQLYNSGATDIVLNGYSLQYASATNTTTFGSSYVHVLSGTIKANSYFLIQESGTGSAGATHSDPAYDLTGGTLALSNSAGKLALFNTGYVPGISTTSGTIGVNGLVDFVGYGNGANFTLYNKMTNNLTINTAAIRTTSAGNTIFIDGAPTVSPTPIPAAAWLFGSGLAGLVGLRRRMQQG